MAMTLNVADEPVVALVADGCVVITGGCKTVRVARLLVTEPAELLTTTVNKLPLSADVVAGVV